ncbi:MAG: hypothetical protein HC918_03730 [Oscillatoriales cyanobacterium SM2_1_8]|nr:hypothetical protein [Oscillatoriales cyanobacterium SM2_1_8]
MGARIETQHRIADLAELNDFDRVVVAAGRGSAALLGGKKRCRCRPWGGQALRVHCPAVKLKPVVRLDGDINVVPLADGEFWVGATVEFPPAVLPRPEKRGRFVGGSPAGLPSF